MPLQVRRKKGGEEGSVMKAEDIEGYRGKEDIDAILSFIEAEVILLAKMWNVRLDWFLTFHILFPHEFVCDH